MAITHTGVDDSSARSVSSHVRKTRNVETLSNLVRPPERPSARPDTNNRAAASCVPLPMITATWLLVAAQNEQPNNSYQFTRASNEAGEIFSALWRVAREHWKFCSI